MSKSSPVAVRIIRCGNGYLVKGRRTSVWCATFGQAWRESIPYFAARKS